MTTSYVVPARWALTVIHIRDPAVPPRHEPLPESRIRAGMAEPTADSHDGRTICGQPMLVDHLWQPWAADLAVDRICTSCQNGGGEHTQEALL